jgi:tRNA-dihydrouridine synthase
VPAQWEKIKEAVQIRDKIQEKREKDKTLIIGNGDVKSREEGLKRIAETGCDGVMIARGAFGFPWMFRENNYQPSIKERLMVALEHAKLFQQKLGAQKSFYIMRKHFKAYASGFDGASELRSKLLETKSLGEAEAIVEDFLKINSQ